MTDTFHQLRRRTPQLRAALTLAKATLRRRSATARDVASLKGDFRAVDMAQAALDDHEARLARLDAAWAARHAAKPGAAAEIDAVEREFRDADPQPQTSVDALRSWYPADVVYEWQRRGFIVP